jgi:ADP-heptose:LPS heptosyltransferase
MGFIKSIRKKLRKRRNKRLLGPHLDALDAKLGHTANPSAQDAYPIPKDAPLPQFESGAPRAAIRVTGGIGDHIIAARFLRDLMKRVGPFEFDLYSSRPETAAWVFDPLEQCKEIYSEYFLWDASYKKYPIAMYVTQFACIMHESFARRTVSKWRPKLLSVAESLTRYSEQLRPHITHHPHLDGELGRFAHHHGYKRNDFLNGMSAVPWGGNVYPLPLKADALQSFSLLPHTYVTLHNGYDAAFEGQRTPSTKIYPYFDAVVDLLKAEFPTIKIVQLGTTTSRPIAGVDLNLIRKTTLPELATLLEGSLLHIDSESGLVHMASCVGTKSVVVFGPTSLDYYGYDDNINIPPTTCGNCWWSTTTWNSQCVRGDTHPRCTYTQKPEAVYRHVRQALLSTSHLATPTPIVDKRAPAVPHL